MFRGPSSVEGSESRRFEFSPSLCLGIQPLRYVFESSPSLCLRVQPFAVHSRL